MDAQGNWGPAYRTKPERPAPGQAGSPRLAAPPTGGRAPVTQAPTGGGRGAPEQLMTEDEARQKARAAGKDENAYIRVLREHGRLKAGSSPGKPSPPKPEPSSPSSALVGKPSPFKL
jgi:hypothetical protein